MALEMLVFPIAERLLEKVASPAYHDIALAWGVETQLETLKDILSTVEAVLLDAEEQQGQNHQLRDWLAKLKDVLYDTEDVLDEFECETLRRRVMKRRCIRKRVGHFFSNSNPLIFHIKMGQKVRKVNQRLNEIAAYKNKFHLFERNKHKGVVCKETHSFVCVNDVVGRKDDKETIIKYLIRHIDGEYLSTIPIVGLGGIGKTTLVKLVYNDGRVVQHFQLKMWICVSDDFNLKNILIKIIQSATGQSKKDLDAEIDQLQMISREALRRKKFLLVLDDVWNEDPKKWFELKLLLMGVDHSGSKIIVTTRSNRVAEIMSTTAYPAHNLSGLLEEDCLSLFFKWTFKVGESKGHPRLMEIGKEIVGKCKGVPLAIITLGSLLCGNRDEDYWKYVSDNEVWKLEQKEDEIIPALRLSYEQLPSHLKRCFAICAIFPKDYQFNDWRLIQFWIAHEFIQTTNDDDQELEVVGSRYLMELSSRHFFQDFERGMTPLLFFKMHDLVHDLASSITQTECLILTSAGQKVLKTMKHLSFSDAKLLSQDFLRSSHNFNSVRTIYFTLEGEECISESVLETCFTRFQHLRALNLRNLQFGVLPRGIGNLKHLRYLNLRANCRIKKLPESIWKLQSLQALNLVGCNEIEELPRDIRYMIGLRCLIITTKQKRLPNNGIGCLESLRVLVISGCDNLEYLFEDMQGLINLRALVIAGCRRLISLPQSVKCLSALKILDLENCNNLALTLEGAQDKQDFNAFGLCELVLVCLPKLVNLPQWFFRGSANTLQLLEIHGCNNLKELPQFLENCTSLQKLEMGYCVELEQRLERDRGADWPKIAHIPEIIVDRENI